MKKALLLSILVVALVLGMSATAYAAVVNASTASNTGAGLVPIESVLDIAFSADPGEWPAAGGEYVAVIIPDGNVNGVVVDAPGWNVYTSATYPPCGDDIWCSYLVGGTAPDAIPGLTLQFVEPGVYAVDTRLITASWVPLAGTDKSFAFNLYEVAEGSVINPIDGGSLWSYQDAYDASPKREGGYRLFDSGTLYASDGAAYDTTGGWVDQTLYGSKGPHGGYDTTTNKCKTCHAVHRAEGTYYLLRATSSDDACDYCHIGGGAHSSKVVYTANDGGKYTNNGHTMGSGPTIPDSSVEMAIEHVTIDRLGDEDIEVPVRVYEAEKKELFRIVGFGRHPAGHPSFGYGDTANALGGASSPVFGAVGPTSLSCSNCHQTHNATALIWQPLQRDPAGAGYNASGTTRLLGGYKLLRAFPGASTAISVELHYKEAGEPLGTTALAKVPESTLLPYAYKDDPGNDTPYPYQGVSSYGVAIFKDEAFTEAAEGLTDAQAAALSQYTDWDGLTWQSPDWAVNSHGWHDYDYDVNQYALAHWCADCHNLNIGGRGVEEGTAELGFFKAHAERTHPVPASRGFQCYSCHRGSLDYNPALGTSSDMTGTSCTNCHFASNEYKVAQAVAGTDWPHSSGASDYKLLGNFSLSSAPSPTGYQAAATTSGNETAGVFGYKKTTVTKDNLDAVCLRCHTDIGTMN